MRIAEFSLGWFITGTAAAVLLTAWVAWRYKAVGAFGLLAAALLPFSLFGAWQAQPVWQLWTTAAITIALFITGMVASKKWDDVFHFLALASSLFMPWLITPVNTPVPVGLLVLVLVFGAIKAKKWRDGRRPTTPTTAVDPATS